MQPADFSKDKAGRLIKASQGYWAFNPAPLPPSLTLTWELAGEISAADRALSELAGVARTLPNPHLITRACSASASTDTGSHSSCGESRFKPATPSAARLCC